MKIGAVPQIFFVAAVLARCSNNTDQFISNSMKLPSLSVPDTLLNTAPTPMQPRHQAYAPATGFELNRFKIFYMEHG